MINTEFIRNNILTFGLELVSEKAILEILDHLEAVESECLEQVRLNGMGSEREAALMAKLEAAERERDVLRDRLALESQENGALRDSVDRACEERDELRAESDTRKALIDTLRAENAKLHARIAEMERQEPMGTLYDDGCFVWRNGRPYESNYAGWKTALYALPGAQGE